MAEFEYSREPDPEWNDRCFLTVDQRYTMAIVRTHNGIEIDIWPINEGKSWDVPFSTIQILDSDTAIDQHPSHHEQP
jgi:hypothetical protein